MQLHFKEYAPRKELQSIIKSFWSFEYNESTPRADFILPNGLAYIFLMDTAEDFDIHFAATEDTYRTAPGGTYATYLNSLIELKHGKIKAIGLAIYPIFLELLFKKENGCFLNQLVQIQACDSFNIPEIKNQLPEKTFESIENSILSKIKNIELTSEIHSIYHEIINLKQYDWSVHELAQHLGYSTRHINNLFKKHLSMSPKRLLQITRFNHGLELIKQQKKSIKLSQIAQQLGYHDQAHFIKEFRMLCGKKPGELNGNSESMFKIFSAY